MNHYDQISDAELDAMVRKVGTMDAGFVLIEWLKRSRERIHSQMEQVPDERSLALLQGRVALLRDITQILTSINALTEGATRGNRT
jgi:predicted transcriptional regulator